MCRHVHSIHSMYMSVQTANAGCQAVYIVMWCDMMCECRPDYLPTSGPQPLNHIGPNPDNHYGPCLALHSGPQMHVTGNAAWLLLILLLLLVSDTQLVMLLNLQIIHQVMWNYRRIATVWLSCNIMYGNVNKIEYHMRWKATIGVKGGFTQLVSCCSGFQGRSICRGQTCHKWCKLQP